MNSHCHHGQLFTTVGMGETSPRNVPPSRVECFKLKTIKVQQTQEEYFTSPFLPKEIQLEKPASGREP